MSPGYLRHTRQRGLGPAHLRIGRSVRYLVDDLNAWLIVHRRAGLPADDLVGDQGEQQPSLGSDGTLTSSRAPSEERGEGRGGIYPASPVRRGVPDDEHREIDELAADIKANGLREPAILWMNPADKTLYLIDGRNRLEALERNGISPGTAGLTIRILETREIVNPAAFVISANIRRRHLTKEQQAELILAAIEAAQTTTVTTEIAGRPSDANDVARLARSFSPTEGQRGGSTKDPVVQAAVQVAKKHDISARTIRRAREACVA